MAPKRGAKRNPSKYNSRADGLEWDITRFIYIDIESGLFELEFPQKIVDSRPLLYGDASNPKLQRSVKDKVRSLKKLKLEDPGQYW